MNFNGGLLVTEIVCRKKLKFLARKNALKIYIKVIDLDLIM